MVRYRRGKRYGRRRRSTNVIRMKFQSFMDISTSASSMQIITISAGGPEILKRLAPQFGAYKYYKIGNISVKLVPASTLPVDPTGLSYQVGESTTVDPRDQLTPGMMRITNGEDVFENISGLTDDQQHAIYNNMLLDPRWYKWMLQSGVKRHATPRYWQIGQLHQDHWPGAVVNAPDIGPGGIIAGTTHYEQNDVQNLQIAGSSRYGLFQTGHKGVLGWLPTDGFQNVLYSSEGQTVGTQSPLIAAPPEVEVMKILLPKAFKTVYYYRLFITETVLFREPIVNFGIGVNESGAEFFYRPLDVFHSVATPYPVLPSYGSTSGRIGDNQTGGNYGNH